MTFIIAEAGVNHNGDIKMAKQLVEIAKASGADAVKFQTFKAANIVSKFAPKAEYQLLTTDKNESQLDMIRKLELDLRAHQELKKFCRELNIEFLSTPFDLESIDLLVKQIGVDRLKIPSGEIVNGPHLLRIAQAGLPIILSTGMASLGEVESALCVLAFGLLNRDVETPTFARCQEAYSSAEGQAQLKKYVSILQCTTDYPARFEEINLRVMDTYSSAFGLDVGYSDHSTGIHIAIAAVARGAKIIEKHFTLDRNLPGPDHKASLEPQELKLMVQSIREVEVALGGSSKIPTKAELSNKKVARKSLVVQRQVRKGEIFTSENLGTKRPGTGVSPLKYWDYLGKPANRDYQIDELIEA